MSKAVVLRTKDDGRFWLVTFDKPAVAEISSSAAAAERSTAASFPMHVVQ